MLVIKLGRVMGLSRVHAYETCSINLKTNTVIYRGNIDWCFRLFISNAKCGINY